MMPRRCRKAVSEKKPPLEFCESPVHIRHKQSVPVHGCNNPITADVVPFEDVLNEWVSPQFESRLVTEGRTARRRALHRTNSNLLQTSTLCTTTQPRRGPVPDHRFKPLRFILDSSTMNNEENEPPAVRCQNIRANRQQVIPHEESTYDNERLHQRTDAEFARISADVNRKSLDVSHVSGGVNGNVVPVDVIVNNHCVESFHNDSSLATAGHSRGARRHTPCRHNLLSHSVDRLTDQTHYTQGSMSCNGVFDINTPVLDQSSLIQPRRSLGALLNNDPRSVENIAHGDCTGNTNNDRVKSVEESYIDQDYAVDGQKDNLIIRQRADRLLRSHSLTRVGDCGSVQLNNLEPCHRMLLDTSQPIRSPRQHEPVLVCDTPSSSYGLSYRSRQLQCFTDKYKPPPARRAVLVNV